MHGRMDACAQVRVPVPPRAHVLSNPEQSLYTRARHQETRTQPRILGHSAKACTSLRQRWSTAGLRNGDTSSAGAWPSVRAPGSHSAPGVHRVVRVVGRMMMSSSSLRPVIAVRARDSSTADQCRLSVCHYQTIPHSGHGGGHFGNAGGTRTRGG
jgi:hypothetical protein